MPEVRVFAAFYPTPCLKTYQRLVLFFAWGWIFYAVILGGITLGNGEFMLFGQSTPSWVPEAKDFVGSFACTICSFLLLFLLGRCGATQYGRGCLGLFCCCNLCIFVFMAVVTALTATLGLVALPAAEGYLDACSPAKECCMLSTGENLCNEDTSLPKGWKKAGDEGTAKFVDCVLSAHPAYEKRYNDTNNLAGKTECLPEAGVVVQCGKALVPPGVTLQDYVEWNDLDASPVVTAIGTRKPGECVECEKMKAENLENAVDELCRSPPAVETTAAVVKIEAGNPDTPSITALDGIQLSERERPTAPVANDPVALGRNSIELAAAHRYSLDEVVTDFSPLADSRFLPQLRDAVLPSIASVVKPVLPALDFSQTKASALGHLSNLGHEIAKRKEELFPSTAQQEKSEVRTSAASVKQALLLAEAEVPSQVDDQHPNLTPKEKEEALSFGDMVAGVRDFLNSGANNTKDFLTKWVKGFLRSDTQVTNAEIKVQSQVGDIASHIARTDVEAAQEFARREEEDSKRLADRFQRDIHAASNALEGDSARNSGGNNGNGPRTNAVGRSSSSSTSRVAADDKSASTSLLATARSLIANQLGGSSTSTAAANHGRTRTSQQDQVHTATLSHSATGALILLDQTTLPSASSVVGALKNEKTTNSQILLDADDAAQVAVAAADRKKGEEDGVTGANFGKKWWNDLLDSDFQQCKLRPWEVQGQEQFRVEYLPGLETWTTWLAFTHLIGGMVAFFSFLCSFCMCCMIPTMRVLSDDDYRALQGEP
ncbi:unnamed protein product [Amoebophrya sp. A120]|nr:unnamed protein product [Amoebophrya sp. A120]|eukprot:GSA120T00005066001.1